MALHSDDRDDDVDLTETQGERRPAEDPAELDPTIPVVVDLARLAALGNGEVDLRLVRADYDVIAL